MNREEVATVLEEHGIQPTRQRMDIASLLFRRDQHVSADQVLEQVSAETTGVSRATVYNTLKLFVRQGVIRQILMDGERTLYDTNPHDHHHLFNVDTGELMDIPAGVLKLNDDLGLPEGTEIEGMDVVVRVRSRRH